MDATKRFSDRVERYIRCRPGYPPDAAETLASEIGLEPGWTIADVGSGTGILTELFLRRGNRVFGVEPNQAMREAAERLLRGYPLFHSVAGAAEATTLDAGSVDLVLAGQAFHWFDPARARQEFIRVLRPGGCVALLWNDRKTDVTPFLRGYETLLQELSLDYAAVDHRHVDAARLRAFFGSAGYSERVFPNAQHFDWDGLEGRALSSSYVPAEGHPRHGPFIKRLRQLFETHASGGQVAFEYDTRLYWGRLS